MDEKYTEITDLSGMVQRKTTKFMAKDNQVDLLINGSGQRIGGIEKTQGYTQVGNTITTTTSTSTSSSTSSTTTSTSTSTSSSTSTSTSTSSTTTMA